MIKFSKLNSSLWYETDRVKPPLEKYPRYQQKFIEDSKFLAGYTAEVVRRLRFCQPKKEVTDGRTDGRTDTPSYRVVPHD